MPTYEYRCKNCGFQFERFQNMSDAPLSNCPQPGCNGTVERLISGGGGLMIKGDSSHNVEHEPCCSRGELCDNPNRCCENN